MPDNTRQAHVVWDGTLTEGSGSLSVDTGVLRDVPVSWGARTVAPEGKTSPEELIAAAHASCYAMALSNTLAEGGHPPAQLRVSAAVTAVLSSDGLKVTRSALTVRGNVPGLDPSEFAEWARKGDEGCPVSNALRGNVEITIDATLEG
jgi:osmotically inducible protein OsmC